MNPKRHSAGLTTGGSGLLREQIERTASMLTELTAGRKRTRLHLTRLCRGGSRHEHNRRPRRGRAVACDDRAAPQRGSSQGYDKIYREGKQVLMTCPKSRGR